MSKPRFLPYLFGLLILILFSGFSSKQKTPVRAMYATVWSISSAEAIDNLLETAHKYKFNQIFFQTRYRGDALYIANRKDSTYTNTEHLCYTVKDSTFDPLAYALEKAKAYNIEIHAWVTVFVVTPHDLWKIKADHIYYTHPEWLTYNRQGDSMANNTHEGAFFDAGVPAAREYFLNVVSDIASNYDIAGIQFDYIRYPDSTYGYNPIAMQEFKNSGSKDIKQWKQNQLSSFVDTMYLQLKRIKPKLQISAAVIAKRDKALNKYSQDWVKWVENKSIDKVYLMAYNTSMKTFSKLIEQAASVKLQKHMVVVLRAWPPASGSYPVAKINEKIKFTRKYHFKNMGFYSYAGMRDNNYLPYIRF